ncbi:hypothetical protein L218DRAFT_998816 [Marasmius fiardii PR-910]|nr:hypothetical protein L218DRAFT_998816 [Marasmius fiardii PR-910]
MQLKLFVVFSLASVVALVSAAPVTIPLDAVPRDAQIDAVEAREPSPNPAPEPFCMARGGGCF